MTNYWIVGATVSGQDMTRWFPSMVGLAIKTLHRMILQNQKGTSDQANAREVQNCEY